MSRIHIPGVLDLLVTSDSEQIRALANDSKLDRDYRPGGPLINRILFGNILKVLTFDGKPFPAVAPHGSVRPTPAQAAEEARLDGLAAGMSANDAAIQALSTYVRTGQGNVDRLAQEAVGRLFDANYRADDASVAAGKRISGAAENPLLSFWLQLTGALDRSRQLLAGKVNKDLTGLHGTAIGVQHLAVGLKTMRMLWADPAARANQTAEGVAIQCIDAPKRVVRQPVSRGTSLAGNYEPTTLVMLNLQAAYLKNPTAENAFMTQSWGSCPAHRWLRILLVCTWRSAQEAAHG